MNYDLIGPGVPGKGQRLYMYVAVLRLTQLS